MEFYSSVKTSEIIIFLEKHIDSKQIIVLRKIIWIIKKNIMNFS